MDIWQKDGKPASHKTAIVDSVLESFLAFNLMLYPLSILLYDIHSCVRLHASVYVLMDFGKIVVHSFSSPMLEYI